MPTYEGVRALFDADHTRCPVWAPRDHWVVIGGRLVYDPPSDPRDPRWRH